MNTLQIEMQPTAEEVHFSESELVVLLTDGRTISVPIDWFSSLSQASTDQLKDYELLGDGEGIHWPQLDEDLSVKGLLLGFH
jgi:hypothetical protein